MCGLCADYTDWESNLDPRIHYIVLAYNPILHSTSRKDECTLANVFFHQFVKLFVKFGSQIKGIGQRYLPRLK